MKIAFVFPGQGSQDVGMGRELYLQYGDKVKTFYKKANDVLGFDLTKLIFEGPAEELRLTENCQPAILLDSFVKAHILLRLLKKEPTVAAGHSLGEYSALVASGVLSLEDGLSLVRKRGEFLQEAVPLGKGKMTAILGLDYQEVAKICEKIKGTVEIANYNSDQQIVISGEKEAVAEAEIEAKKKGALKVIELKVSCPFHCSLLLSAQEKLKKEIEKIEFREPNFPVISTVSGQPEVDPKRLKELLMGQITAQVRWLNYLKEIAKLGVKKIIEVGPGKVLTTLNKRTLPELTHLTSKEIFEEVENEI